MNLEDLTFYKKNGYLIKKNLINKNTIVNLNNQIRTGICTSKPEILQNGKIVLVENWQWTNGDKSKGKSKLLEV